MLREATGSMQHKKSLRQFAAETLHHVILTISGMRKRAGAPVTCQAEGTWISSEPSGGQQLPPRECLSLPDGGAMLQPKAQVLDLAKKPMRAEGFGSKHAAWHSGDLGAAHGF